MNTCDLLEFEAQSFKEKLLIEFSLDEIIKNERKWIFDNLFLLYNNENILDVRIMVNPYLIIKNLVIEEEEIDYVFLPKYLGKAEFFIYYSPLKNADKFLKSIKNYGEILSGVELINIICDANPSLNNESLKIRLNNVFRKFLSYQYLVICESDNINEK
ncbi:MAG: hypothetical protein LRY21_01025 [Bacteroides graminisolvens]|nr:hypothetical protein [Acetoanaerobium sp.]MCD8541879.1 hypothetical protein [Bacteroides graminisolvens]